ncbi:MAG: AraC family transcriptional regulator [Chitinophagaceae bacterium]
MQHFELNTGATDTLETMYCLGDIDIREWQFRDIRILYFEGQISESHQLDLMAGKADIVMCFNLQGKSNLSSNVFTLDFSNNEHNTFYNNTAKLQLNFEASALQTFMILLRAKSFFDIGSTEHPVLKMFHQHFNAKEATGLFTQNQHIDFLLQTCINAAVNCKYENSLKRIFLFSKVAEMIVLQLESYKNGVDETKRYIKTEYDKERIVYAKDYLLKNIESPPSLKQLARASGINEFKLKKGFKELFGQTVFEYLSEVRLEIAKNELQDQTKTISQIAFELGYSSLQHFSNSFKRKFGVSPGQLR